MSKDEPVDITEAFRDGRLIDGARFEAAYRALGRHYRLGEDVVEWDGTQPESTAARDAPTVPPMILASSSRRAKGSGPPSPRPPETTMRASSSLTPSASSITVSITRARA